MSEPMKRRKHIISVTEGLGCWWFYKEGSLHEALRDHDGMTLKQARTIRDFCELVYEKGRQDAQRQARKALGL